MPLECKFRMTSTYFLYSFTISSDMEQVGDGDYKEVLFTLLFLSHLDMDMQYLQGSRCDT